MKAICAYCNKEFEKSLGHYNRAKKFGLNIYCNRYCAGLGRRTSIEEKKKVKAAYDKKISDTPNRKKQRHSYFMKDYAANPEKYRAIRKAKYKKHLAYLNTPEYKKWKKDYDLKLRTKKCYGSYAEAAMILFKIEKIVDSRLAKNDAGLINKSKKRKKLCNSKNKNYQPLI